MASHTIQYWADFLNPLASILPSLRMCPVDSVAPGRKVYSIYSPLRHACA